MNKVFFWLIILTCQLIFAQNINKITLAKVDVVGNTNTSKNTIVFTSGLREGQLVNPADFPRAIKRLWQLGLFQDIQLQYEKETEDGLFLVIKVVENYILGDIKYEGNRKIKESKFEEELGLTRGQRIKLNTLNITRNLIEKLYAEKGYLNAEVNPLLLIPDNNSDINVSKNSELTRNIVFNISENKKTKINKIIFKGNNSFSDFRLRWQMKETKQQPFYMFWRSTFDNSNFKEDLESLSTFYRNKGYRDFEILKDTIQFSKDSKKMNIVLSVSEGEKYNYRNFSWEGMSLFSEEDLQNTLALEKGEQFSDEDFNLALYSRVQGLYLDRGYIYSRVEPQITPVGRDSLDIHFVITENHKVYINNIIVQGNTRTRENVIRRQLRVFPGDVYNQERIARSYREVMMLNFLALLASNQTK